MKKFARELRKKLTEGFDTPSFVEIRGQNTLLCDGFDRITVYRGDLITLCSGSGCINIKGDGLVLKHLSLSRIAVEGRIEGVDFT